MELREINNRLRHLCWRHRASLVTCYLCHKHSGSWSPECFVPLSELRRHVSNMHLLNVRRTCFYCFGKTTWPLGSTSKNLQVSIHRLKCCETLLAREGIRPSPKHDFHPSSTSDPSCDVHLDYGKETCSTDNAFMSQHLTREGVHPTRDPYLSSLSFFRDTNPSRDFRDGKEETYPTEPPVKQLERYGIPSNHKPDPCLPSTSGMNPSSTITTTNTTPLPHDREETRPPDEMSYDQRLYLRDTCIRQLHEIVDTSTQYVHQFYIVIDTLRRSSSGYFPKLNELFERIQEHLQEVKNVENEIHFKLSLEKSKDTAAIAIHELLREKPPHRRVFRGWRHADRNQWRT